MITSLHASNLQQVETGTSTSEFGQQALSKPIVALVTPIHATTAEKSAPDQPSAPPPKALATSLGGSTDFDQFARDIDPSTLLMIPAGVTIKGELTTGGGHAIVIGGHFVGDIDAGAHPVIIKAGASVVGCVRSDDCVIVAGRLSATEKDGEAIVTCSLWVLAESGMVKGDVVYGRQRAYEGGVFSGRARPFSEYSENP